MEVRVMIVLFCIAAQAHGESPVAHALAGACVAVHDSSFAPIAQGSSLSLEENIIVAFAVEPSRFGLKELQSMSVACSRGFQSFAVGIGIERFGDELYNENRFVLSCAFLAPSDVRFGASVNAYHHSVAGYGSAWTYSYDFSLSADLSPALGWGAVITNITSSRIGSSEERLPSVFRTGFLFRSTEHVSLITELRKELDAPFDASFGMIYSPYEIFSVRCGAAVLPSHFGAGLSVDARVATIEYGVDRHSVLGFTHSFAVVAKL